MADVGRSAQVVVVGVDGSMESIAALGWARRYAAATGAKVRAVHAWHYPTAFGVPPEGKVTDTRARHRAWVREHGEDLPEVQNWAWPGTTARS